MNEAAEVLMWGNAAVRAWPRFAAEAEVREDFIDQITRKLLKEGD